MCVAPGLMPGSVTSSSALLVRTSPWHHAAISAKFSLVICTASTYSGFLTYLLVSIAIDGGILLLGGLLHVHVGVLPLQCVLLDRDVHGLEVGLGSRLAIDLPAVRPDDHVDVGDVGPVQHLNLVLPEVRPAPARDHHDPRRSAPVVGHFDGQVRLAGLLLVVFT